MCYHSLAQKYTNWLFTYSPKLINIGNKHHLKQFLIHIITESIHAIHQKSAVKIDNKNHATPSI